MNKVTKNVALYMRSSINEDDKGGITRQRGELIDFVIANNFTITKEYVDEGFTGNTLIRPALDQLRVDSGRNGFDSILIYDPTILARTLCFYELILNELIQKGIKVLFVTTPRPVTDEEILIDRMKMVFTEYQDCLRIKNSASR